MSTQQLLNECCSLLQAAILVVGSCSDPAPCARVPELSVLYHDLPQHVPTTAFQSTEPDIHAFGCRAPHPGDIVIFKPPPGVVPLPQWVQDSSFVRSNLADNPVFQRVFLDDVFIKRVVAVAGDTVEVRPLRCQGMGMLGQEAATAGSTRASCGALGMACIGLHVWLVMPRPVACPCLAMLVGSKS